MGLLDRFRRRGGAIGVQLLVDANDELHFLDELGRVVALAGVPADHPTITEGSDVSVVGVSYYQDAFIRLTGGPTHVGYRCKVTATLVPEPTNAFDQNAVAVYVGTEQVGYLSRQNAVRFGPLIAHAVQRCGECDGDGDDQRWLGPR